MFEAALAETNRRLTAVESIETDAQRVCHDAGEVRLSSPIHTDPVLSLPAPPSLPRSRGLSLTDSAGCMPCFSSPQLVRTIVARRDELLRVVLPGYTGGLPWSFMQQPIQPLDTTEVRHLYDRLSNLVQSRTDPATAFKVYRELKDVLNRCLPHIPPMPQGGYDRSGLDSLYGAVHMWGNRQGAGGVPPMMGPPPPMPVPQYAPPPTLPPNPTPTGLAMAPPPPSFLTTSPKIEGLGSAGSAQSPSLFSANGFAVGPPSPGPRAGMPLPGPLTVDSTTASASTSYQPPAPSTLSQWTPSSESTISSPTDSPHRIITSAMSDLSLAAPPPAMSASPARPALTETSIATQSNASSIVRAPPAQARPPQPPAVQQQQQATAAADDGEPGEELRGVVACLLNDTHDEGFCEVRGPNRQHWNVYFNLHGGKVATTNPTGFDPAILEAGYEVFVKLTDNPDQARAAQDAARK